jgi:hypothetical protein
MGLFNIFKSKKQASSEIDRREFLHTKGRITDGTLLTVIFLMTANKSFITITRCKGQILNRPKF